MGLTPTEDPDLITAHYNNYVHNNQWLCTSLGRVGRARDAIAVARNLVELPRDPELNNAKDADSAQRNGRLRWAEVLIRYELWDDLITATESGALDWSEEPFERLMQAYSLGLAYSAKGNSSRLADQIAALRGLVEKNRSAAQPRRSESASDAASASQAESAESARPLESSLRGTGAVQARLIRAVSAKSGGTPEALFSASRQDGAGAGLTPEAALAELEGHQLLAKGDIGQSFVKFARATAMLPESRARAHLSVENRGFAMTTAKAGVDRAPDEVVPLATYVEILHAIGKDDDARRAYGQLRGVSRRADNDLPIFRRLERITAGWHPEGLGGPGEDGTAASAVATEGADLSSLGPLTWSPLPAGGFTVEDTDGRSWSLARHKGRNVLAIFYLGGTCPHCLQQLQLVGKEADAFRSLNTDVVAIGTDDLASTKALNLNGEGVRFPMPMLPDPTLSLFKSYRCFDDFEQRPLHGTFLIDGEGRVRYQNVSSEPFLDVDFLKRELRRINTIATRPPTAARPVARRD